MAQNENKIYCELCNLEVTLKDFHLTTNEGEKAFCCEGCKSIYQLLNKDKLCFETPQANQQQ